MAKYTAKQTSGTMTNGSKWIRPEKRLAIYLRDEFHCVYCNCNLHGADPRNITLDHVKPRSKGGNNSEGNLITACLSCNSARGNKSLSEWADSASKKAVRRQTRRSLTKYFKLAKELISTR